MLSALQRASNLWLNVGKVFSTDVTGVFLLSHDLSLGDDQERSQTRS